MKSASTNRYRDAYEDECKKAAEAAAAANAVRVSQDAKLKKDHDAVPGLRKRVAERLAEAKAVDKRIALHAGKGQPHEWSQSLAVQRASILTFAIDAHPGKPVAVQAKVLQKGAPADIRLQGVAADLSDERIDEIIEGWLRSVAHLAR